MIKTVIYFRKKAPSQILDWDLNRTLGLFTVYTQPALTCSKLTIEALEQGVNNKELTS